MKNYDTKLKKELEGRAINEACYIIDNKCTIRECAEIFKLSKSTIWNDIHTRLYKEHTMLFNSVMEVLEYNWKTKHIRGGQATKNRHKNN